MSVESGYTACQKRDLQIHTDSVHEKIRNYVCEECGHSASRKQHLMLHIEKMHKKEDKKVGIPNEYDKDTTESSFQQKKHLSTNKSCSDVSASSGIANVNLNINDKGNERVTQDNLDLTEGSPTHNEEVKEKNDSQKV